MKLKGTQIIIEELVRHGVEVVFGYPGGSVLDLYDELYKNSDRVRHVLTAHEQGAAHAADGYARVTGKTGVVIATSGPGATNLVTGIANAYLDSVPLVAITGNVAVPLLGKDSFQEVDIVGITQPIVKHNFIVRDIGDLERILNEAFYIAGSGRKGPVLVDIPKNIQREEAEYSGAFTVRPTGKDFSYHSEDALRRAVEAIERSERPYLYCGGGVSASSAGALAMELSGRISAPIGLSIMGIGAIPASYPLNLGLSGMHGSYASSMAHAEADLIIAAGVRFSDRATGNPREYVGGRTIIHIDIDHSEANKNIGSQISLCGDAKQIFGHLLGRLTEKAARPRPEWQKMIEDFKSRDFSGDATSLSPRNVIERVNAAMPPETVVATDVGQHQMWTAQYYKFERPRTLLTSGGLGAMGFGFGAAIGGCTASGKPTLLFTGDGSFGMNLNEFATAVSERLPILICVFNNRVLGMVRQWQSMFYGKRYSQTNLGGRQTDFAALARAFGADGRKITSLSELDAALKDAPRLLKNGPYLLDIAIDSDERVLPMIPPGGGFKDIVTE